MIRKAIRRSELAVFRKAVAAANGYDPQTQPTGALWL